MAKNAVTTPNSPKSNLPTIDEDFANAMGGMGTGLENVGAGDLLIPRLTILQGLSPQVVQGKPEFDPDAKVGDIYDVGLQEIFRDGLLFLPVHWVKQWLEWYPRNTKKGLAEIHDTPDILDKTERDEKKRPILPNGNYIAETAQFYGFNVTAGMRRSFLPMASTQLKKSRRLLTLSTGEKVQRADGSEFTPPLFYRTYHLTTGPESNTEGDWMGWKIERGPTLEELPNWRSIMGDIKGFRDALTKGDIRGDIAAMAEEAGQTIDHEGEM